MEYNPYDNIPVNESGFKPPEADVKDKKDKDKDKKDSKKSKAIGSLTFEHPEPVNEKDKPRPSLVDMLVSTEDSEKTENDNDVAEDAPDNKPETAPDSEPSPENPEMTDDDRLAAAQQIAEVRSAELAAEPVDSETEAETAAAQDFYERIINHTMTPEEAAAVTLSELDQDADTYHEQSKNPQDPVVAETKVETPDAEASSSPSTQSVPHNRPPVLAENSERPVTGPNTQPQPSSSTEYVPYIDRSRAFGDVMVGGVVGYLVGRRRGRIKTERKLVPIQKRLEREVTQLSRVIAAQESTIRKSVRERAREQSVSPAVTEVVVPLRTAVKPERVVPQRLERQQERQIEQPRVTVESRPNTSIAAPPEHIGKVLVAAETVSRPVAESTRHTEKSEKSAVPDVRTAQKRVEALSRNELLMLSEKIPVEGSTLRQVYETHLISERGLRRLVVEHLRGGDIVKAFRRELIERQIDFERDPKLRDTIRKNLKGGGGKSSTLQKLLAQHGLSADDDTQAAIATSRAAQQRNAKKAAKRRSQQKLMDASLLTIIAVLVAFIVLLAVRKV